MRLASTLLIAAFFFAQQPSAAQIRSPQGPTFRSSVEVTTLDVTVVEVGVLDGDLRLELGQHGLLGFG